MCIDETTVWDDCGHSRRTLTPCLDGTDEDGSCCIPVTRKRLQCVVENKTARCPGLCLCCTYCARNEQMVGQQAQVKEKAAAPRRDLASLAPPRPVRGEANRDSYIEPSLYAAGMHLMSPGDFNHYLPAPRPVQVRARPGRVGVPPPVSTVSVGRGDPGRVSPLESGQFDHDQSPQTVLYDEVEAMWRLAGRSK